MRHLLVAIFVLLAAPAIAGVEKLIVHAPHYGYLNLRAGPGVDHKVIKQMPHGDVVEVVDRHARWYRVIHNRKVGWAHASYFKDRKHEPKDRKPAYVVHAPYDHFLNLRTGPGTAYHVIGKMPHGSKVRLLGERHGRWVAVKHVHSGKRGWAHIGWLKPRRAAHYY